MTRVSVVVAHGAEQQHVIDDWTREHVGSSLAAIVEAGFAPTTTSADVQLIRLFAGCVCCVGHVALRVAVTRLLRVNPPDELLLVMTDDAHLERVRALVTDGSLGVRLDLA